MDAPQDGSKGPTFAGQWLVDAQANTELDQSLVKLVADATTDGELDADQLLAALQALDSGDGN